MQNRKCSGRELFIDPPFAFFRFPTEINQDGESQFTKAFYSTPVVIFSVGWFSGELFDSYSMAS